MLLTNDTFAQDDREDALAEAQLRREHKGSLPLGICKHCEQRGCAKCRWTGVAYVAKAAS